MIIGIGIDIEEVKRFKKQNINTFLNSVFTKREINYCVKKKDPSMSFAGKFCAKEAVIKALKKTRTLKDIEILNGKDGKIRVYVDGIYRKRVLCSVSHTKNNAIAFAIVNKAE